MIARCSHCKKETEHRHMHDTAHGLEGTHMDGSERYECEECGCSMSRAEAEAQGLKFVLDK